MTSDFTSSLYLGMRHPSRFLRQWKQLTTGFPDAIATPVKNRHIAQAFASLQGCEQGIFGPSTLHLFFDLFGMLKNERVAVYMDAELYPVARMGLERLKAAGKPVRSFPHRNAAALSDCLKQDAFLQARPVVVTDGFCTRCGKAAPVKAYLDLVRRYRGMLVIDDTQSLGILGHSPSPSAPYGHGGGGILRWSSAMGPEIILVSSLAKGFGVPLAILSGSAGTVRHFMENSETRVHCSPPSAAAVHAAEHALAVNSEYGEILRQRLLTRVRHFRKQMAASGCFTEGGLFPVQTLSSPGCTDAGKIYGQLMRHGVKTVLRISHRRHGPLICFVITALHGFDDIDRTVKILKNALEAESIHPLMLGDFT